MRAEGTDRQVGATNSGRVFGARAAATGAAILTACLAVWLLDVGGSVAAKILDDVGVSLIGFGTAGVCWWVGRRRGWTELVRSEARFRSLLVHSSDAIIVLDAGLTITEATDPADRVLGVPSRELAGRPFQDLVDPVEWPRVTLLLSMAIAAPGSTTTEEMTLRRSNGGLVRSETVVANLLDDPNVAALVLTIHDVTERRALEARNLELAFRDPLTGLPNRSLFHDRVEHAIPLARRNLRACGVLFIDLDNFQQVNDGLGHAAGDELLQVIAGRIQHLLRNGDSVARLGGDEFAILAENCSGPEDALAIGERLLAALRAPVAIGGRSILPRASIGIATTDSGSETADDLLRDADVALNQAKRRGRGCVELFQPAMHAAALRRLELEEELRRALEEEQFVVYYQPVVRLADGSIAGLEALIRWQHPTRGLVLPGDFIPLAEETGLILPIGTWMLAKACHEVARLQRRHGDDRLRVAVNLSSRQLADSSLPGYVASVIEASGIDPSTLVLEITESVLMADTEDTTDRMRQLRALGLSFAMDDFGTGYSSLSYLRRYPIQMLKIDRSFITALGDGAEDTALVLAILSLANTLGMQVVAEGIEFEWQAELLARLGCTLAQGFHFAQPMDAESLARLMAGRQPVDEAAGAPTQAPGSNVVVLRPLGSPAAQPAPAAEDPTASTHRLDAHAP